MGNKILILLKKKIPLFIAVLMVGIFYSKSSGQVQIDSIKTTVSTCANNGGISIYAKGLNPPLYYSIVAGPLLQPVQTGNIFNALPPGNYKIKVADGLGNNISQNAVITGNYLSLDFNPLTTDPYCVGGNDGKIIGNRINNTGNGPFTWQLIAPSPITRGPQSSDVFNNLVAGNYTMRLTDGCGSFRTIVATVSDPVNATVSFTSPPRVEIIGCDSGMVSMFMQASLFRFPMTYKFETTNGTFTTTTPTLLDTMSNDPYFTVQQVLPNFTYGNYLRVTVTNSCGYSVTSDLGYARSFNFCSVYTAHFDHCNYLTQVNFDLNNPACFQNNEMYTFMRAPVTYQFVDAVTNVIADSGTIQGDPAHKWYTGISGITIKPLPGNRTYNLTIKDGCGKVFYQPYYLTVPVTPPPRISGKSIQATACVDSAASAFIFADNFKTRPVLILLSGPSAMGSTKPGYVYTNPYSYPDTLVVSGIGANTYRFDIVNLAAGTYHFKVIDSCGTALLDSLVISPTEVTDFNSKFSYKKGCLGKNEIHYSINAGTGFLLIQNTSSGVSWFRSYYSGSTFIKDSVLNIPSGNYSITFNYQPYFGGTSASPIIPACQSVTASLTIEGYQTPTILTSNSIVCHNTINVEVIPDSTKGVPPYQYEIISGPQTFPVQNGNIFQVTAAGTYTVRIYDVCGNGSTKQISVDNIAFAAVDVKRNCNNAKLIYPSSTYYTYKWIKPDGAIYLGDSLIVNPVTPSDTGTYTVSKIVSINGCHDTVYSSFHMALPNFYQQTIPFCTGTLVHVGTKTYNAPGLYKDTLHTIGGCDSIVVTSLVALPQQVDSNRVVICKGDHITIGTHVYNMPGVYKDSLQNAAGCYDIKIITLKVNGIPDTINKSICAGDSVRIGNSLYKASGTYTDSLLSHLGCDSIIVLHLVVAPNHVSAAFTANPANGSAPLSTSFINQSTGAITYKWTLGNANASTAFQPSAVYNSIGDYTVMMVASDQLCSDTAYTTIHVTDNSPQLCVGTSGIPIFSEDFGSGTSIFGPALPGGITNYTYHVPAYIGNLVDDEYVISNSSCFIYNTGWWKCNADHTGNANGYMMVVNGSTVQSEVYRKHITGLCPNTKYVLSAWVANANSFDQNCPTYVYANIDFKAEYPAGIVLNTVNTGALTYAGSNLAWVNAGVSFVTQPGQTWADVVIYNKGAGACGNDFVIDDISLVHCPGAINPVIAADRNNYCEHDTLVIRQTGVSGYTNPEYQWQYGAPGSNVFSNIPGATSVLFSLNNISVSNAGSYQLLISENGNINSPNCRIAIGPVPVVVNIVPANVNIGSDTSICLGQSLLINAGVGYTAYYWNDDFSNPVRQSISVNVAGKYWVAVKNQYGCIARDTLELLSLYPLPVAKAGTDTTICIGASIQLLASGGISYQWVSGPAQSVMQVSPVATASYTVVVYDAHQCSSSDEVTVFISNAVQQAIFENKEVEYCFEEGPFIIGASWGKSFLWSNTGDTTQSIAISQGGSYAVTVYDHYNCPVSGSIEVKEHCEPRIFLPKAFSPNGDGENDELEIFGKYFTDFEITIFNRWGEIIFISTDKNKRWDGMYRGEPMEIGTYPWMISYQSVFDGGKENKMKGSITLIR